MRKFTAVLLVALSLGVWSGTTFLCGPECFAQKAEINVQEEASILYEEAIELKKQGNLAKAIESYMQAMRKDRAILAYDDNGLIEDLKKDCESKLEKDPGDVKTLETLGFVNAVCYSDYKSAIYYYEKVLNLVKDEGVKERTANLIERLKQSAEIQKQYESEVAAQNREERLKSWSEMERIDRFGQEAAESQAKAKKLAEMYKQKDSLKNRVSQLEQELKDLREEYDKANRLWYSLKDDLYYRRRRRLKDDIAAKEKEVEEAKEQLESVEEETAKLEREVQFDNKQQEESPIKTYENYQNSESQDLSAGSEDQVSGDASANDQPAAPPSNDYGSPDDVSQGNNSEIEEPLPAVEDPDFPADKGTGAPENETAEEREKRLQELINSL